MSCYDCERRRDREWAEEQDQMFNYDFDNPPTERTPDGMDATVMYDPFGPQPDTARMWREDPEGMRHLDDWLARRINGDWENRILRLVGRDLGLTTIEICRELSPGSSRHEYQLGFIERLIDQGFILREERILSLTGTGQERVASLEEGRS